MKAGAIMKIDRKIASDRIKSPEMEERKKKTVKK